MKLKKLFATILTALFLIGAGAYYPHAADFDSTDYLSKGADLTGDADTKTGIISLWLRIDGGDGTARYVLSNANLYFVMAVNVGNKLAITGKTDAGAVTLEMGTVNAYAASQNWLHFLASWDLAAAATHIYISDTSDKNTTTANNNAIDYTRGSWGICSAPAGANYFPGAVSEFYFTNEYLDFSVEANRRKYISASGKPVSLGSDGSTPTGSAPLIYMKSRWFSYGTNSGSGGAFTINGTLTRAKSPNEPPWWFWVPR